MNKKKYYTGFQNDNILDIDIVEAPTGRAKCVLCNDLIEKDTYKLLVGYRFYKYGSSTAVTSHRSCCSKCAPEFLDRRSIKEKFNGRTIMTKLTQMFDDMPIRNILQKEMNSWLGEIRI